MDLLCGAYGVPSDEENEGQAPLPAPVAKKARSEGCPRRTEPPFPAVLRRPIGHGLAPAPTKLPPAEGRYISKRERAILAAAAASASASASFSSSGQGAARPSPLLSTSVMNPGLTAVGSISDLDIPHDVLSALRHPAKDRVKHLKGSIKHPVVLSSHTKAVNALQWSRNHMHLLASASMDQTVCVWNVWSRENKKVARIFTHHNAAVKDVRWSPEGLSLLSCGYDCCSRLVDVENGIQRQLFKEDQVVGVVKFHPDNHNLFLSGGSKGSLRLWDIRTGNVAQEYVKPLGPIFDVEFSTDARHLISSSDVSKSNASENSIIVWDVSRQIPLSNQVYVEAYTCPCIRYHPSDACFVAQSNGNYIAIFSARPPFKLDRYKRYEKHAVSGFPIKCNFSLDGNELASGSADGCIYFYNYTSAELVRKLRAFEEPCTDVAYHPVLPGVIAACGWNGEVSVFQ
ncbi:hypothetical protein Taro_029624 [Colocasia esculenta]|uniref:WD repeat-containing protein 25 n=1 Tax=Colocasia esculenta TaxID=4460 RepID=A0A843VPJ7_COLES|nr:hypothetical protein [Colocasia esculenta]